MLPLKKPLYNLESESLSVLVHPNYDQQVEKLVSLLERVNIHFLSQRIIE